MRLGPAGARQPKANKSRILVTSGTDAALSGLALVFIRTDPRKEIHAMNVTQVPADDFRFGWL